MITYPKRVDRSITIRDRDGYQLSQAFLSHYPPMGGNKSPPKGPVVPGYRLRIRNHQDATTGVTAERYAVVTWSPTETYAHQVIYPGWVTDNDWKRYNLTVFQLPSVGSPWDISESEATRIAKAKFVKILMESQTMLQSLVVLGERRETLQMIRDRLRQFLTRANDYLNRIKRFRSIRSWRDKRRAVADSYLEYSFGWAPMLGDIDDASKAWNQAKDGHAAGFNLNASHSVVTSSTTAVANATILGDYFYGTDTAISKCRVTVRGYVSARSPFVGFTENFGLSVRQFIPTLWELLPLSFLVDYVVNVNDVINAHSALTGALNWCNITVKKSASTRGNYHFDGDRLKQMQPYIREASGGAARVTLLRSVVTRGTLLPSQIAPPLEFNIPNPLQGLNTVALANNHRATSHLLTASARRR